jgi:hypothetical protein
MKLRGTPYFYVSYDDGSSWTLLDSSLQSYLLVDIRNVVVSEHGTIVVATSAGIFYAKLPTASVAAPARDDPRGASAILVAPNPIDDNSTISFTLPLSGTAIVSIWDIMGRPVTIVASGEFSVGAHTLPLLPGSLPAGSYFCRLESGGQDTVKQVTFVR